MTVINISVIISYFLENYLKKIITLLLQFNLFNVHTGVTELISPGDHVRTIGGKLNGSENEFNLLNTVGFSNSFSLLITLRVQPKVSEKYFSYLNIKHAHKKTLKSNMFTATIPKNPLRRLKRNDLEIYLI